MNVQPENLWSRLRQANLVRGETPETAGQSGTSPWYVKVLLGFSGWLAALFLMGFIGMAMSSVIRERPVAFMMGCGMLFAAYILFKKRPEDFQEHLALAISLVGQLLVIYAIMRIEPVGLFWFGVLSIAATLTLFMPNAIHRFFTAVLSLFSLKMLLAVNGLNGLFDGMAMLTIIGLWHNEFRYPARIRDMHAVGYGAILALVWHHENTLYVPMMRPEFAVQHLYPWVGELFLGGVLIFGVWLLMRRHTEKLSASGVAAIILAALFLGIISFKIPLLGVGVLVLLLGFGGGNRVLMGLGGVTLLYAFAAYYFQHDPTLMEKSLFLCIAGGLLLGMRFVINTLFPAPREVNRA